jgi:CRP/FNR family cyclic AMP-dependent transcriptional regulator
VNIFVITILPKYSEV